MEKVNENEIELYGYDLESDLDRLYGDECEVVNELRIYLFSSLGLASKLFRNPYEITVLGGIIQNIVPVTNDEFAEWITIKNRTVVGLEMNYKERFTDLPIATLNKIEKFVEEFHLIKEISES